MNGPAEGPVPRTSTLATQSTRVRNSPCRTQRGPTGVSAGIRIRGHHHDASTGSRTHETAAERGRSVEGKPHRGRLYVLTRLARSGQGEFPDPSPVRAVSKGNSRRKPAPPSFMVARADPGPPPCPALESLEMPTGLHRRGPGAGCTGRINNTAPRIKQRSSRC